MTQTSMLIPPRRPCVPRRAWLGAMLAAWLLAAPAGQAVTRTDLYQAMVPTPERSESGQSAAFAAAMKLVLVRVTGRRSAGDDPALAPLVAEARRYVQQYHAAPDGQLSVAFDGNAVERWLAQNGQPIWGRERPATFVWLALPAAGTQAAGVARHDDPSELRAAVDAEAQQRGIPLRWPTAAELQAHHVDYAAVAGGSNAGLVELGQRLGGEGVLIGRPAGGGAIQWVHQFQDHSGNFSGVAEGVDGAADVYATLFAASGAPVAVDVEVAGLADVVAYARVQAYFESLSFVAHVGVRALDADRAQLRLSVRGGASALQRATALNSWLVPQAATDGTVLRYQFIPR